MNTGQVSNALFAAVLENTEVAVIMVDGDGRAVYMNSSARNLLQSPKGELPEWVAPHIQRILEALNRFEQTVDHWTCDEVVLRVRARPLHSGHIALEATVSQIAGGRHLTDQLARGLQIPISDAKMLSFVWRGMSNDEIAQVVGVRVGTVKSRLFRLYQRLGVKRRPAAMLRVAEVLAT